MSPFTPSITHRGLLVNHCLDLERGHTLVQAYDLAGKCGMENHLNAEHQRGKMSNQVVFSVSRQNSPCDVETSRVRSFTPRLRGASPVVTASPLHRSAAMRRGRCRTRPGGLVRAEEAGEARLGPPRGHLAVPPRSSRAVSPWEAGRLSSLRPLRREALRASRLCPFLGTRAGWPNFDPPGCP
jgi:hypothetical protein